MKKKSGGHAKTEHDHGSKRPATLRHKVLVPSNVQIGEINIEFLAEILEKLCGIVPVHAKVLGQSSFSGKLVPPRYWPVGTYKSQDVVLWRNVNLAFAGHAIAIIVR